MLPIVATLVASGLSLLGNAVMAKGKDVIEEKLGVKLDEMTASPEGLLKLKQLEFDHEKFLIEAAQKKAELELEGDKVDNANTASARDMNVVVQNSEHASDLAKNTAYYIDMFIVAATVIMIGIMFFQAVPSANKEIFFTALGSLLTMCGTILNFHRGTSARSKSKDDAISGLIKSGQL